MTIYGPHHRRSSLPDVSYYDRVWYTQRPRTNKPLPYNLDIGLLTSGTTEYCDPFSWAATAIGTDGVWTDMDNKIYKKIVDQMKGSTAAWGANLATWKQSHGMIVGRATQLLRAARYLKAGRFKSAAKVLGISKGKPRHKAADLAGQWLELSYGWLPLLADIHSSVEVLQEPLPPLILKAGTSAHDPGETRYNQLDYYQWQRWARCGCRITALHPGAYLANKLGLVNPATVLWEVVPFSFVVDWFLPVGRFLESFTDFVGVTVEDAYTTHYGILDVHTRCSWAWGPSYAYADASKRRVQMKRWLSLPEYRLKPRFTGFYSMRGANAIALLVGALRDLKH